MDAFGLDMQKVHDEWVKSWTDPKAIAARARWDEVWKHKILGLPYTPRPCVHNSFKKENENA